MWYSARNEAPSEVPDTFPVRDRDKPFGMPAISSVEHATDHASPITPRQSLLVRKLCSRRGQDLDHIWVPLILCRLDRRFQLIAGVWRGTEL